jgi:hypothetical protein
VTGLLCTPAQRIAAGTAKTQKCSDKLLCDEQWKLITQWKNYGARHSVIHTSQKHGVGDIYK